MVRTTYFTRHDQTKRDDEADDNVGNKEDEFSDITAVKYELKNIGSDEESPRDGDTLHKAVQSDGSATARSTDSTATTTETRKILPVKGKLNTS